MGNMNGESFCGDTRKKKVHDLDNELSACHIDEIIQEGKDRPFHNLIDARIQGYENCIWCIGNFER